MEKDMINKICQKANICVRFLTVDECPPEDRRVNSVMIEDGGIVVAPFDDAECLLLAFFVAVGKIEFVGDFDFDRDIGISDYARELLAITHAVETAAMVYDTLFTDDTVRWAIEKAATLQR